MPPQLHSGCSAAKGLRHRWDTSSRPQRMRCVREAAEIPGDSQTLQLTLVRSAVTATCLVLSPSLSSAYLAGMDAVVVSVLKHKYSKGRSHSDRPDTPCSLPPLTYHPDTGSLHTDRHDASVHTPHLHPLQENVAWSHHGALQSSAVLSGPLATMPAHHYQNHRDPTDAVLFLSNRLGIHNLKSGIVHLCRLFFQTWWLSHAP